MPDNYYNKVRIAYCGKEENKLQSIKDAIFSKTTEDEKEITFVDFKKTIPPPANMFEGSSGDKERKMCKEQGIPNWYDWQTENWGTKWNAYNTKITLEYSDIIVFEFQTAWYCPEPIFKKWIEMFKGCEITILSVCEGGSFADFTFVDERGKIETQKLKEQHSALFFAIAY